MSASPCGSVYLEPGRRVMGETSAAAERFYRESGLVLEGGSTEMTDHMAEELEFMSCLLRKAIFAQAAGDAEGYSAWVVSWAGPSRGGTRASATASARVRTTLFTLRWPISWRG